MTSEVAPLTDFHNHVMPGVDDGAQDVEQSAEALAAMTSLGIGTVVTTPHVDGALALRPGVMEKRLEELDAAWTTLTAMASERFAGLDLRRGAELKLSLPEPDVSDRRLRLDGGRFVLVEFALMSIPPRSDVLLQGISRAGYVPVLAHPERYAGMRPESRLTRRWKEVGALFQINAGSLSGRYGAVAQRAAIGLLELGLADYMCTDYHARGTPSVAGARRFLEERGAAEQFEMLTTENPNRMLDDEAPLLIEPLPKSKGWKALLERLRR